MHLVLFWWSFGCYSSCVTLWWTPLALLPASFNHQMSLSFCLWLSIHCNYQLPPSLFVLFFHSSLSPKNTSICIFNEQATHKIFTTMFLCWLLVIFDLVKFFLYSNLYSPWTALVIVKKKNSFWGLFTLNDCTLDPDASSLTQSLLLKIIQSVLCKESSRRC